MLSAFWGTLTDHISCNPEDNSDALRVPCVDKEVKVHIHFINVRAGSGTEEELY